jgi:uncharacterized protein YndB with AHSA1/START domain
MLVRRPASEVHAAFIDPDVTSKFWFTRGSGKLARGVEITWYWDMYGVSAQVKVLELEQDRRILIEWPAGRRSQSRPARPERRLTVHSGRCRFPARRKFSRYVPTHPPPHFRT